MVRRAGQAGRTSPSCVRAVSVIDRSDLDAVIEQARTTRAAARALADRAALVRREAEAVRALSAVRSRSPSDG